MIRFLSRLASASLVLAVLAGPALAQSDPSPSHVAIAREVVIASGMSRSFEVIIPQFEQRVRQQLVAQPQLAGAADEVFASLKPEMELQQQAMINRAAAVVAKRLSEDELKAIAEFFNSPAGRRYVETQPVVLDDVLAAMEEWSGELAEYLQVRVRVEMSKRGHQMP